MDIMTRRLRRDWFHRYVIDPQAYRPGTRMPSSWPNGKTTLPGVLDGDTSRQVEAIWQFLSDGRDAREPYGLRGDPIVLAADERPVLYRNFIEGAGTRAIGVGYPGGANLAFDANEMRLALIWQGAFMDAARHWTGRGQGFQPPLGGNVLTLADGPPLAVLPSGTARWPVADARELGYRFRGYRLDDAGRPAFRYDFGDVHVEERPEVIPGGEDPAIERTFTIESDKPTENLWLRALVARSIEPGPDGTFTVDGEWTTRLRTGGADPVVRRSGDRAELLVPIDLSGGKAVIEQEFLW